MNLEIMFINYKLVTNKKITVLFFVMAQYLVQLKVIKCILVLIKLSYNIKYVVDENDLLYQRIFFVFSNIYFYMYILVCKYTMILNILFNCVIYFRFDFHVQSLCHLSLPKFSQQNVTNKTKCKPIYDVSNIFLSRFVQFYNL